MASITFAADPKLKSEMSKFLWVNWSALAKEEFLKQEKEAESFEKFKKIVSKSKFSKKDAEELANKVRSSMHKKLKHKGLL